MVMSTVTFQQRERIFDQIKSALWELEAFFSAHLEHEGREFAGAKYQENVQNALTLLSGLNELSSIEEPDQVLKQIVALSQLSMARPLQLGLARMQTSSKKRWPRDYNEGQEAYD